jgi:hypothetical protein
MFPGDGDLAERESHGGLDAASLQIYVENLVLKALRIPFWRQIPFTPSITSSRIASRLGVTIRTPASIAEIPNASV